MGSFMLNLNNVSRAFVDSSSKGNQSKFFYNGHWIKLDSQNCCEGLAENFVSKFCATIADFPYVPYNSSQYEYMDSVCTGCHSYNMYGRMDMAFVSFRSILRQFGMPQSIFFEDADTARNIMNVVSLIRSNLGVDTLDYFRRLLMLDFLIINEDRHLMNIGLCYCKLDSKFYEAPCFDNGSSLFCVNWTYRKRKTLDENIVFASSVARPFSEFFDTQLSALLSLGCKPLMVSRLGVETLLSEYYNPLYTEEMNTRIKSVLSNRLYYYYVNSVFVYV